jgi:hypothetical protein
MELDGFRGLGQRLRGLFLILDPPERIASFNGFSIPEIATVAALIAAPTLNAAAPIKSTAAVPAGTLFTAFEGLRVFPSLAAGACTPLVLNRLLVRRRCFGLSSFFKRFRKGSHVLPPHLWVPSYCFQPQLSASFMPIKSLKLKMSISATLPCRSDRKRIFQVGCCDSKLNFFVFAETKNCTDDERGLFHHMVEQRFPAHKKIFPYTRDGMFVT